MTPDSTRKADNRGSRMICPSCSTVLVVYLTPASHANTRRTVAKPAAYGPDSARPPELVGGLPQLTLKPERLRWSPTTKSRPSCPSPGRRWWYWAPRGAPGGATRSDAQRGLHRGLHRAFRLLPSDALTQVPPSPGQLRRGPWRHVLVGCARAATHGPQDVRKKLVSGLWRPAPFNNKSPAHRPLGE
jgi:hypothetical protein